MVSTSIWAHGGGLNKKGCHNNTKTGDYHCHKKDLIKVPIEYPKRTFTKLMPGIYCERGFFESFSKRAGIVRV